MQTTTTVLGKRKARTKSLVLHGTSESEPEASTSTSTLKTPAALIIVNGTLVKDMSKKYRCTFKDCEKAYTKPSRLEEHERSHSGERPYVCTTCSKSYLRETHLQAHIRSHLPERDRPFACSQPDCEKRFWTAQHLKVHTDAHAGAKAFPCPEQGCNEEFSKHNQLRAHIAAEHAPPGTKPFRCEHPGCTKSFQMNQQLKTHSKVHDEKRYTCVHPTCLSPDSPSPSFYPTWTALQHHMRTVHPPTCTHASCIVKSEDRQGRVFASQKGLRAHQKIHEARDLEQELEAGESDSDEDVPSRKKRRRGGELGRDWKCDEEGCEKDFKSKKSLTTHMNVTHLGRRDHVCPREDCATAFGYKHLLARHLARSHDTEDEAEAEETEIEEPQQQAPLIDMITGKTYQDRATQKLTAKTGLKCPWPHDLPGMLGSGGSGDVGASAGLGKGEGCEYVFSRAYDLRRHLRGTHEVEVEKEVVDGWVQIARRGQ